MREIFRYTVYVVSVGLMLSSSSIAEIHILWKYKHILFYVWNDKSSKVLRYRGGFCLGTVEDNLIFMHMIRY